MIHLGEDLLPTKVVRAIRPPGMPVSLAVHGLDEIDRAATDLVVFGPVWGAPSKRAFGTPQGLDCLRNAVRTAHKPLLAIGGIDASRAPVAIGAGAAGVEVVRAVLTGDDPAGATRALFDAVGGKQ